MRISVAGQVQGVGYRAWLAQTAEQAGLHGWVRNRTDGTVEALLVGPSADVDAVVTACHSGPPLARVDTVARSPAQGLVAHQFVIKPTV